MLNPSSNGRAWICSATSADWLRSIALTIHTSVSIAPGRRNVSEGTPDCFENTTKGKAAFIGDGASDLEAKPAVDLFIGFGGVHMRPRVRENADVFVTRLDDILPYLI